MPRPTNDATGPNVAKGDGWMRLHRSVLRSPVLHELPTRALVVYLYIGTYAHEGDGRLKPAWPSIPTMATDTGLTAKTVQRALKDLRAGGLLQQWREGRYWKYQLLWPGTLQEVQRRAVEAGHLTGLESPHQRIQARRNSPQT